MTIKETATETFYSESRITHNDVFGVYKLTEREKRWLGLKKPAPLKGSIHIVIPVHYGSRAVTWESRFVTEGSFKGWLEQYPDLQVIEGR